MTDSARALIARASALTGLKRAADAVPLLQRAVIELPEDLDAWCELARAELSCGNPDKALQAANRALAHHPGDEWPHRVASIALGRMGQHEPAVQAAREAARLAPDTWQTLRRLAEAIDDHPQPPGVRAQLRAEAWAAANRAVELAPLEPAAHCTVGHLCLGSENTQQAQRAFREALRLDPGNALALNGLGLTSLRDGRSFAATAEFGAAAAADPHDNAARSNIVVAVWLFALRMSLSLILLLIIFGVMAQYDSRAGRLTAATVVLSGLSVLLLLRWRRVPLRLRSYVLRLPRREPLLG